MLVVFIVVTTLVIVIFDANVFEDVLLHYFKKKIFFNPIISGCRPTFLVFDSDNSLAFASLPHYFDMPLVVLMSPQVSKHACVLLNIRFWLGKVAKKNSRKKSGLLPCWVISKGPPTGPW